MFTSMITELFETTDCIKGREMFVYEVHSPLMEGDIAASLKNLVHKYKDRVKIGSYPRPERKIILAFEGFNEEIVRECATFAHDEFQGTCMQRMK